MRIVDNTLSSLLPKYQVSPLLPLSPLEIGPFCY